MEPVAAIPRELGSPLFTNSSYPIGYTQFGNALLGADFWPEVQHAHWGTLLTTPHPHAAINIYVPANEGLIINGSAFVDNNWWNGALYNAMSQLNLDPHTLTLMLTKSLETSRGVLGFHTVYSFRS